MENPFDPKLRESVEQSIKASQYQAPNSPVKPVKTGVTKSPQNTPKKLKKKKVPLLSKDAKDIIEEVKAEQKKKKVNSSSKTISSSTDNSFNQSFNNSQTKSQKNENVKPNKKTEVLKNIISKIKTNTEEQR
jgi:hypothetical protein